MVTKEIIVSDLLFFVKNKFSCRPCEVLQGMLVNFYSEGSIASAKLKLYDEVKKLLGDIGVGKFFSKTRSSVCCICNKETGESVCAGT